MVWWRVKAGPHRCDPWAIGTPDPGDIWECPCGRRWLYRAPGNPAYEGWVKTWPTHLGLYHRQPLGIDGSRGGDDGD